MSETQQSTQNWSHIIRDFRVRRCLTQSTLASILDVDQAAVSRWESGRDEPRKGTRRRIVDLMRSELPTVLWSLQATIRRADVPMGIGTEDVLMAANDKMRALLPSFVDKYRGKQLFGNVNAYVDQRISDARRLGISKGDIAACDWVTRLDPIDGSPPSCHINHLTAFKSDLTHYLLVGITELIDEQAFDDFVAHNNGYVRATHFDELVMDNG